MSDLISVIIPVYKVEAYLDECISSVTGQTYKNLEIILVDDGSPDNCPAMCDVWAEKDSRIRVIHKENGGLSDARNAGIEAAAGEYIAFVDSDDWIKPQMYETMLTVLLREHADICSCNILSCFPDHQAAWDCGEYTAGSSETFLAMLYHGTTYPVSAWSKLYRRSLWGELRFPEGKICEDAFTTYLLVDKATRIVQIPEPLYCYRIRENSIMTSAFRPARMDEEEAWRYNYEFVRQHYPAVFPAAYAFYLQKVNILLHTIPKALRQQYVREFQMLRGILRKNLGYIAFSGQFAMKQRAKLLLDFFTL